MDIFDFPEEEESGPKEYKFRLICLSIDDMQSLASQMQYRINQGNGEAFYELGVLDNGFALGLSDSELDESLANLELVSQMAGAVICDITRTRVMHKNTTIGILKSSFFGNVCPDDTSLENVELTIAEVFVREKFDESHYIDIKIAVAGNVDSGKSTLIGILSSGKLDDGDGFARQYVLTHKHERESGRTSSITQRIIGFDSSGTMVNDVLSGRRHISWSDIVTRSSKIITLYDLAGHKRYLSTTIHGIHAYKPDYVIVMMDRDVLDMTIEHIIQCIANGVPFIIVMSKIDITPIDKVDKALSIIKKLISGPGSRKLSQLITSEEDVITCLQPLKNGHLCPIFKISSVTGEGIHLLKKMLNILPPRINYPDADNGNIIYEITDKFKSAGHPAISGGTLLKGSIQVGSKLQMGPFSDGTFRNTTVRSIEIKRVGAEHAVPGDYTCLSLSDLKKSDIVPGMLLLDTLVKPIPSMYFTIEITVCGTRSSQNTRNKQYLSRCETEKWSGSGGGISGGHSTKIRVGYEPIVHVGSITEAAHVYDIIQITRKTTIINPVPEDEKYLLTRDKAIVVMKFCFRPHIVFKNDPVTFREGRTRGIGYVTLPGKV